MFAGTDKRQQKMIRDDKINLIHDNITFIINLSILVAQINEKFSKKQCFPKILHYKFSDAV